MEGIERWKLADQLNVYQIALLLGGVDPAPFELNSHRSWPVPVAEAVVPHLVSLQNAIRTRNLETVRSAPDIEGDDYNWHLTLVDVQTLRWWLFNKGVEGTFFDPERRAVVAEDLDLDLDYPLGAFYSPKLAAAAAAWRAVVRDPSRRRGKSPKQALETWLTEHASALGLVNRGGSINKQGIEEIAKVANWQPNGGAPKTPTVAAEPSSPSLQTPSQVVPKPKGGVAALDLDDDIPF